MRIAAFRPPLPACLFASDVVCLPSCAPGETSRPRGRNTRARSVRIATFLSPHLSVACLSASDIAWLPLCAPGVPPTGAPPWRGTRPARSSSRAGKETTPWCAAHFVWAPTYTREKERSQSLLGMVMTPYSKSCSRRGPMCMRESTQPCATLAIGGTSPLYAPFSPRAPICMPGGDWALCSASQSGHDSAVLLLLLAGADVHAGKDAALRLASRAGHVSVVRLLLRAGADVHARGDEALRAASWDGYDDVVCLLLEFGAHARAGFDDALRRGNRTVLRLLEEAASEGGARVPRGGGAGGRN